MLGGKLMEVLNNINASHVKLFITVIKNTLKKWLMGVKTHFD